MGAMIRGALSACETRMGVAAPGCRAHKLPSSRAQPLACRVLRAARLKAALSVEPAAGVHPTLGSIVSVLGRRAALSLVHVAAAAGARAAGPRRRSDVPPVAPCRAFLRCQEQRGGLPHSQPNSLPRLLPFVFSTGASGGASRATSDTWLGSLFLRLLPGAAGYAPCVLYPAATLLSGLAAAYAPACVGWVAGLPLARALGVAPLLAHVATVQPWATLLSVTGSLLTALLAFFATPALDFVLGRDLRNPEEVGAPSAWAHPAGGPVGTRAAGPGVVHGQRTPATPATPAHRAAPRPRRRRAAGG